MGSVINLRTGVGSELALNLQFGVAVAGFEPSASSSRTLIIDGRKQDNDDRVIERHDVLTRLLPAAPHRYRAIIATAAGTGLRWGEATGLCTDALDLEIGTLQMIRTVVEINGHTTFKLYPKSSAGRRAIPLPDRLLPILRDHTAWYRPGRAGLIFPNQVGMPLRRALFAHVSGAPRLSAPDYSAPSPKSTPPLAAVTSTAPPGPDTGDTATETFRTYPQAIKHVARHVGGPTVS